MSAGSEPRASGEAEAEAAGASKEGGGGGVEAEGGLYLRKLQEMKQRITSEGGGAAPLDWSAKQSLMLRLEGAELSDEEARNVEEVRMLLSERAMRWAMMEAKARFDKWMAKSGSRALKVSQEIFWEKTQRLCILDALCAEPLNLYGVAGFMRGIYRAYSRRLMKSLMNGSPSGWLQAASNLLREWSMKPDLRPNVLHVLTHLVLKLAYWMERG